MVDLPARGVPLEIGRGRVVREESRAAILSFGTRLGKSLKAVEALSARGVSVTVADARIAKPLNEYLILRLARGHEALIAVEEGAVGGCGSMVAQLQAEAGVFDRGLKFRSMVLPDIFIDQASPEAIYRVAGLGAAHVEAKALEALGVAVVGKQADADLPKKDRFNDALRVDISPRSNRLTRCAIWAPGVGDWIRR